MRLVVDTNVLVSALLVKEGKPGQILKQIDEGRYTLLLTEEIVREVEDVLRRPRIRRRYPITDAEISSYLDRLRKNAIFQASGVIVNVVTEDPDDDKFPALALAGQADCIISGDFHMVRLQVYESIPILTPAQFVAMHMSPN
ncbi:MAG: putative toxin-antitoxin system toxin component, PIN family [Chloroflexi bacterium]|nr:putative toxin-antitoxin system toxin component, PIN family [Chloroflexota bacterium]